MLKPITAACGVLVVSLAISSAFAQGAPTRIRGTIQGFSGSDLTVETREGPVRTIKVPDGARIAGVAKAELSAIKAGDYVGTAAMPTPDGKLIAIEVLVFPEAMRGAGEGHRDWDLKPQSTMTNATVSDAVSRVDGRTLTLTYKEGAKTVEVAPEAPIVTLIPADRTDLKPGAKVVLNATGAPDALTAASITVSKNGIDPPM